MAVFDALRHLSEYLKDSHPVNHLADLYELVQYAGNIIPRLYLMITVGTVYMAVEDAPVKEIMKDMMEMSRGVQHPIRGLFIRYYLSGQARDYLPAGTEEGPQGNLTDSINFILTNFVEMNKLWVRWQHQGHSREREQRTQERRELELLVGSNLVRLSQLVDMETYRSMIIVPLLEQVVQCRDVLAQEYLLEVITKVFPDEYHLHTLDQMLSAIARLNPHVDMKKIVIGLMDRLSSYAQRETESGSAEERQKAEEEAIAQLMEKTRIDNEKRASKGGTKTEGTDSTAASINGNKPDSETTTLNGSIQEPASTTNGDSKTSPTSSADVKLFEIFYEQVVNLVKTRGLTIQDTMALLTSLANLALNIYPEKLEYVDQVLSYASEKAAEYTDSPDLHSAATQANMLGLLLAPIKTYLSLFTALTLPHYLPLFLSQSYATRRSVAGEVARTILRKRIKITLPEHLEGVLTLLRVIIKEGIQQPGGYPGLAGRQRGGETDETVEEQGWLARIVHMLEGADNDTQLKLIQQTKRSYEAGNERIKYTTPALITASMKLARKYKSREHFEDDWKTQSSTLYRFMHQTLTQLYTRVNPGSAELCLRLFVSCGQIADQSGFEEFAYEFFAQAFTIYEDSISDSRLQFQAVCILAGALQTTRGFGKENYDTLITKAALHGSKLLKKPDQCRAVYLASHLWWAIPIQTLPPKDEEEGDEGGEDTKNVSHHLNHFLIAH